MTIEAAGSEHPLRADARRNRERILEAARAAFAEEGIDAGMSEIAERAGVGVGTLYRRFPTKDALIDALMLDHMGRLVEKGEAFLQEQSDPWQTFVRFLRFLVEQKRCDEGFAQLFAGRVVASAELRVMRRQIETIIRALIRRAQDAGALRADVSLGDVGVLLSSVGSAPWLHGDRGRQLNERFLAIVIDGLRAPAASPLPYRPASLPEIERLLEASAAAR
jgi:AcrR family transcriptional regulator